MNVNIIPTPSSDTQIPSETLRKKYLYELRNEDPSADKVVVYFNFESDQELKTMLENILALSELALEAEESLSKDAYVKKIKELIIRKSLQIDL